MTPLEKLLLDIAKLIMERLELSEPVPIPTPVPTPSPTPDSSILESAPEHAVKVTNGPELLAAMATKPAAIALRTGIYDIGAAQATVDWTCDIRGGYDDNWLRPETLPDPWAKYDPATGNVALPRRLWQFLQTGQNESVITRSTWLPSKVGENLWYQLYGRLDRVVMMGTRNAATDQAVVMRGGDRQTTHYQDVITVQRFTNSHGYVGLNIAGGESAVFNGCIFFCPFVGRTGNCRPQFLIGSDDTPQLEKYDQRVTLRNSSILMPINGGYHRLNFICGAVELDGLQFISPNPESYWNYANMRNVGVVIDPTFVPFDSHSGNMHRTTGPDVDWTTTIKHCEFVMGYWVKDTATRARQLIMADNLFSLRFGMSGPNACLWGDRGISIDASNIIGLEQGPLFPEPNGLYQSTPANRVSMYRGGKYVWAQAVEENLRTIPVCVDGPVNPETANVLTPTVTDRPYKPPVYEGITITAEQLNARLIAGGEVECVRVFDETYPALKDIP